MKRTLLHYSREYLKDNKLKPYRSRLVHWDKIRERRREISRIIKIPQNRRFCEKIAGLPKMPAEHLDFTGKSIVIGRKEEISDEQQKLLYEALWSLRPWRKGPFEYFGNSIDSEWDSSIKWKRVLELAKPELEGRVIADVGCNNLYYIYKMLPHNPRLVVGLDPMVRYYFYHSFNRLFFDSPRIHFDLMGAEDLPLFKRFFDVVFFMGIIYHRRDPLGCLTALAESMRSGAHLIFETLGIPGDDPVCLFPESTYMKSRGYWFIPTAKAVCQMLGRTGFEDIKVLGMHKTTTEEQRQTKWIQTESLDHFLDPEDPDKTVEGYPAPYRIYISARRKKWK